MQFRSSFVRSVITYPGARFPPLYTLTNSITVHQGGASSRSLATIPIRGLCTVSFLSRQLLFLCVYSNIEKSRDFVCVLMSCCFIFFGVVCRHQEARRLHHRAFSLWLGVVLVLDLILGLDSLMAMLPTMVMVMRLGLWLGRCFSSIGAALGLLG